MRAIRQSCRMDDSNTRLRLHNKGFALRVSSLTRVTLSQQTLNLQRKNLVRRMLKNSVLWVILPPYEICCADKYRYHLPLSLLSDFASNQEWLMLCSISMLRMVFWIRESLSIWLLHHGRKFRLCCVFGYLRAHSVLYFRFKGDLSICEIWRLSVQMSLLQCNFQYCYFYFV